MTGLLSEKTTGRGRRSSVHHLAERTSREGRPLPLLWANDQDLQGATAPAGRRLGAPASLWLALVANAGVSRPISRVLSGGLPLRDGHSSGTPLARRLEQPTRAAAGITPGLPGAPAMKAHAPNLRAAHIRSCSRWGLPCRLRHRRRGALLPHRFTLAPVGWPAGAVSSLWHFPWGRPRRPLAATDNPWSPDFPPPRACGRKAGSRGSGRPAG